MAAAIALPMPGTQGLDAVLDAIGTALDDLMDRPLPSAEDFEKFGAGALKGLGAFYIGYWAGSILFPAGIGSYEVSNPGNWKEYLCTSYPRGELIGPSYVTYPWTEGPSPDNCITGQFAEAGGVVVLRAGYWIKYGPAANQHAHLASFLNAAGTATPTPTIRPVPRILPVAIAGTAGAWPGVRDDPFPPPGIGVGSAGGIRGATIPGTTAPTAGAPPIAGSRGGTIGNGVTSNSGSGVNVSVDGVTVTDTPTFQPPAKGTKEIKGRAASPLRRAVMGVVGTLTEGVDLTMCANKALPGKYRAKPQWVEGGIKPPGNITQRERPKIRQDGTIKSQSRKGLAEGENWRWKPGKGWHKAKGYYRAPTVQETAAAIYKNANQIDIQKFALCFIENEIEDRILGAIGKKAGQAASRGKRPVGYQTGPAF